MVLLGGRHRHGRGHEDLRRPRRSTTVQRATAIMTSNALRAAIVSAIVALMISGCGVTGPDAAACKAAMQAQYVRATGGEGHFGDQLTACEGLPKAEVRRFAQQILQGR